LLSALLRSLLTEETKNLFDYSIVVVDNDRLESARPAVEAAARESDISMSYHVESEQNIALARNRAVTNAAGEFIAFIDDDECPAGDWLLNLYRAQQKYGADGVLGPVRPSFDESCPAWLERSGICDRPSHASGSVMTVRETRTGNVLLKREIFDDPDNRFDPQFGRSGGEDVWFFHKVTAKGRVFVWCEEAPVYESIPAERRTEAYYLKRSIRIGGLSGDEVRTKGLPEWAWREWSVDLLCIA